MADGGDLSGAAKLYRALRRDGVIHGLLSTCTGGLVRMRRKFSGDPAVTAWLEGGPSCRPMFDELFPPSELALLAADGRVLGVGVGEMLPTPDGGRRFCRLDPEFLRYDWSEDAWYYHSTTGRERVTPGDGRWILHCPGGRQEPWAHGLWASLGRGYIAKEHAFFHRENYSAKLANPARVAVAPLGSTEAQRQSWFQKVMAWGVNTVFGMSPGYDVKLLESNGRGYEVFDKSIETSDREFMIAIVGQVVTVTGGAGFANADIHATVRADILEETGDGLSYTVNTQGIPPVIGQRFGAGFQATVAYDTSPIANLKTEAESLSAAAKAVEDLTRALEAHGLTPDAAAIAAKFGVPIAGDLDGDALPDATAGVVVENDTEGQLEDTAVADLAAKMTAFKVARCEHGRMNRCPLCGIERVRDFVQGPSGPVWSVSWRPIGQSPKAAA
jgi:hypothetical protein